MKLQICQQQAQRSSRQHLYYRMSLQVNPRHSYNDYQQKKRVDNRSECIGQSNQRACNTGSVNADLPPLGNKHHKEGIRCITKHKPLNVNRGLKSEKKKETRNITDDAKGQWVKPLSSFRNIERLEEPFFLNLSTALYFSHTIHKKHKIISHASQSIYGSGLFLCLVDKGTPSLLLHIRSGHLRSRECEKKIG